VPLTYFDSSAMVKRYVLERGSAWVRRTCVEEPVAISRITVSEVASALARRAREGRLTPAERDDEFGAFLRHVDTYELVELETVIAGDAASLLLSAPPPIRLRALDMLHVATARLLFARARRMGIATGSFVSADRGQLEAAAWAGLPIVNPEEQP